MHNEHYLSLLLNLGAEHPVAAAQAIYNKEDTLLLGAGSPIDGQAINHLTTQPLRQPLLCSLTIENGLTHAQLCQDLAALGSEQPELQQLANELEPTLKQHPLIADSLLAQHLTVMRERTPALYQRTLLGAVLSGLLSSRLLPEQTGLVWQAALGRLCGHLYLTEDILGKLTHKKLQKQLEQFPTLSWQALAPELPSDAANWLCNQQENRLGSGYPSAITEATALPAQLLNAGDWYALLCQQHGQLTLRDALPALQVLRERWDNVVFQTLQQATLELNSPFTPRYDLADNRQWLNTLLNQQGQHQQRLRRLKQQLLAMPSQRSANACMFGALIEELLHTCASAGLVSDEYQRWVLYVYEQRLVAASEEMHGLELQLSVLHIELARANSLAERLGLGQVGRPH
ncbi:hypothetical protein [Atopomonas sediminilitoris]|uniref:hypothetical protein n=1 Tax=Atopomonas sediminilitoris TaxID=2919919 RepID=UPI001F4E2C17|nr:hypothetical protein [Atopomonas sediminilitoris]MCJ8168256.1 hypothetical protein [Atopomonas sediminilitoris]